MSTLVQNKLKESFKRRCMREKMLREACRAPDMPCEKCGAQFWQTDIDGEWYCFTCGNRGAWRRGEFVQQFAGK